MFDLDRWQEIWQTITRNKLRSFMTAFGVFWGIFMLVIMLGSGKALKNGVYDGTDKFERNTCFMMAGTTSEPYAGFQRGRSWNLKESDLIAIENNVKGVKFTVPYVFARFSQSGNSNVSTNNVVNGLKAGTFDVQGITPNFYKVTQQTLLNGHFLNTMDLYQKRKVCVIGEKVKNVVFGQGENPIGAYIRVNGIYVQVVGIVKSSSKMNIGGSPEESVYIPYSTAKQVFNIGETVHFMAIVGKQDADITQIEKDAKDLLRVRNKISPTDEQAILSINVKQQFQQMNAMFLGVNILIWIVGLGTLLAGVIGVSNIMLITIRERTKEIGIRRAIGATPKTIISQIVTESTVLTLVAGMGGLVLGVWGLQLVSSMLSAQPQDGQIFFKNPGIDFTVAIIAVLIMVMFGALAGIIPAKRAINIKPIDAIREE